uniref:ADP,ATP carrier protein n=1 Tax=Craspedostauros australis TaxID=1486917 RepID=A0A7R9WSV6_9STRA
MLLPTQGLRVRSMGLLESKRVPIVLDEFLEEKSSNSQHPQQHQHHQQQRRRLKDLLPLWAGFGPTASRELAFAIPKFLAFDIFARLLAGFANAQADSGALPVQVGVGTEGLIISALAGSLAGVAGGIVSHPFDLILTYTSSSKDSDWRQIVKDLLGRDGGFANLFLGLAPRLTFFILVIGLQFFLYDYFKSLLNVGQDDLSLVLDVFYGVRQGLVEMANAQM